MLHSLLSNYSTKDSRIYSFSKVEVRKAELQTMCGYKREMAHCRDQRCAGCAVADLLAQIPPLEETCPCPGNGKVTPHDSVLSLYFPSDVSHKVYFGPDPSTIQAGNGSSLVEPLHSSCPAHCR